MFSATNTKTATASKGHVLGQISTLTQRSSILRGNSTDMGMVDIGRIQRQSRNMLMTPPERQAVNAIALASKASHTTG